MKIRTVSILVICLFYSCSNRSGPLALFKKLSPHDQYAQQLQSAGLSNTALGRAWQEKAVQILSSPLTVTVPYLEQGYFAADKIDATALSFNAKRGQKINLGIQVKPGDFAIYADLFFNGELIASADSTVLAFEIKTTGQYLLRLQPELLKGGEYTLSITAGPSLHFPVAGSGHPKIGSFWGQGRDDNARKHEGIDIFAPKGTPALAADSGTVVNVGENKLGGLVVLMRPEGRDYRLYYAHLGVQLVHNGQHVKSGDTVGLIDNTGNAKNTPSHLHFGIYTNGGAIDPLVFVEKENQVPPPVTIPVSSLNALVRINDVPVTLLAASKNLYKVSYPDNEVAFVPAKSIKALSDIKRSFTMAQVIYDRPDTTAARMAQLTPGEPLSIKGSYKNYKLAGYKNMTGWIISDKK